MHSNSPNTKALLPYHYLEAETNDRARFRTAPSSVPFPLHDVYTGQRTDMRSDATTRDNYNNMERPFEVRSS
jgi:hypothetical protein